MRRLSLLLALSIFVATPAFAETNVDGYKPPPEFTIPDNESKLHDYDIEELGYPPQKEKGEKDWSHLKVKGKTWRFSMHAKGKKGSEIDAVIRTSLKAQGWEILTPSGTIVARRPAGTKTEWFKCNTFDDYAGVTVVREIDPPHTLTLPEPKATPETFGDADDFPFLGHFPGAKLKSTAVTNNTFVGSAPGVKPELFVGSPTVAKYYQLPSTFAPLELVTIYESALQKAGWTIVRTAVAGDSLVVAHYAKNGRDLYCYIHDGTTLVADMGAQNEAKKLAEALDKDGHIAIYGIYFDVDKDVLKPESETALQHILDLLKKNPKLSVEIQGHTDDTGDAAHNQTLSEERAASVKKWLVAKGIADGRLKTKGYGATKPVGDNKTPEGRAKNRRVELAKS